MKFSETKLKGAFVVDIDPFRDERGYFSRMFCRNEFIAHGLNPDVAQCNVSFNHKRGTLRGMHYQLPPSAEVKFIRCVRGAIFDVIIDLRKGSPTYMQWVGVELTEENGRMFYVPEGFAHGYQTLADNTEVQYMVSEFYSPEHERGVRHDDPAFGIEWPIENPMISEKDRMHDDYTLHHKKP